MNEYQHFSLHRSFHLLPTAHITNISSTHTTVVTRGYAAAQSKEHYDDWLWFKYESSFAVIQIQQNEKLMCRGSAQNWHSKLWETQFHHTATTQVTINQREHTMSNSQQNLRRSTCEAPCYPTLRVPSGVALERESKYYFR